MFEAEQDQSPRAGSERSSEHGEPTARRTPAKARRASAVGDCLAVAVEDYGDVRCIRLIGELDLNQLTTLRAGLAFGNAVVVEIDLSHLDFMDAAGLSALLRARRQGSEQGRTVRLVGARRPVRRVFSVTGLEGELDGPWTDEV